MAPVDATRISTPQFDLTTYLSDREAAVGTRITVVLDVEPGDGMHIYAPGAENYQVIGLEIDPEAFLDVLPMEYPPSGEYYFEPFDETVPVYEEPFTLLQQVVIKGDLESQGLLRGRDTVTLTGTLRYQACDAAICYVPGSAPLTWTVSLRSLVFR
jgi:hypothetical protein